MIRIPKRRTGGGIERRKPVIKPVINRPQNVFKPAVMPYKK